MNRLPLGEKVSQPKGRDPSVLYPIPRKNYAVTMYGYDLWRSYELSWLNERGKPRAGILECVYPVQSECIVESKSLKLYLGGLSYEKFASAGELEETIKRDLEPILVPKWIEVRIIGQDGFARMTCLPYPVGICLDTLDTGIDTYRKDPALLSCGEGSSEESLFSDLLKTNCPITGQPDWASVAIRYRGKTINHEGLLRYVCSYRDHEGFAEEVCEQIFSDLVQRCSPEILTVRCFYMRRGGIDINPIRSTEPVGPDEIDRARLIRQ
ncbi:MAG TPA: NADPH-dependent 7-cyano-7-deazaguanine reductase QueF [Desulfomonilia bacterium]|nr:NADPH-dependent 7-cyano-7-deazaguanine reductase QueF [Desulfomonilia bacterium]